MNKINKDKVLSSIFEMKGKKTVRLDGLPINVYKILRDIDLSGQ